MTDPASPETTIPPTVESSLPDDAESLVGPVNATFAPLAEESSSVSDTAETKKGDEGCGGSPPGTKHRSRGCLHDFLLMIFSALLGAGLALLLLLGINGTLDLNEKDKTIALDSSLQVLRTQQAETEQKQADQAESLVAAQEELQQINQQLKELEERAQALEENQEGLTDEIAEFYPRFTKTEENIEQLQENIKDIQTRQDEISDQVTDLADSLAEVENSLADVQKATKQFSDFLDGLTQLMLQIKPQDDVESPPVSLPQESTPQEANDSSLELFPPRRPLPTPASDSGIAYGLVWLDANENAMPDEGESPVAGVRVLLKDGEGNTLLNMISGIDGRFAFINIPPGDYHVEAIANSDYAFTTDSSYDLTIHHGGSIEIDFGLTKLEQE